MKTPNFKSRMKSSMKRFQKERLVSEKKWKNGKSNSMRLIEHFLICKLSLKKKRPFGKVNSNS